MIIRKKYAVIIMIVAVSLCIIMWFLNNADNNFDNLKGSIIAGELNDNNKNGNNKYNVFILNLENMDKVYVDSSIAQDSSFAGNDRQLLNNINNEIYLYDIESNKNILLCKVPYERIKNIRYIDNDNISFFSEGKLILFNIKLNEQKIIADNINDSRYSYSPYSDKFYFSDNGKICEVDLESGNRKYIVEGYGPVISKKGNVLAYVNRDTVFCRKRLIIKNITTGEVWESRESPYCFVVSPDEDYLIMRREGNGFRLLYTEETIIYDYKNKKEMTIIDHGSYDFVLDWI